MSQAKWPTENCNHWLQKLAWSHVSGIQLSLRDKSSWGRREPGHKCPGYHRAVAPRRRRWGCLGRSHEPLPVTIVPSFRAEAGQLVAERPSMVAGRFNAR